MKKIEDIIRVTGLHPNRILNIYAFGSRIYCNSNKDSDWDFIVIAKSSYPEREFNSGDMNVHVLTPDRFQEGLDQHNIRNIECLMAPSSAILQEKLKINFKINLNRLRHSISHTVSNSWVKAKKKILQGDYYIGTKSLWHSMRIAMFGIQLSEHGRITDWSCANDIWKEIQSKTWTWEELDTRFRSYNNSLMTKFRASAPRV